jgi:hypothetical protein
MVRRFSLVFALILLTAVALPAHAANLSAYVADFSVADAYTGLPPSQWTALGTISFSGHLAADSSCVMEMTFPGNDYLWGDPPEQIVSTMEIFQYTTKLTNKQTPKTCPDSAALSAPVIVTGTYDAEVSDPDDNFWDYNPVTLLPNTWVSAGLNAFYSDTVELDDNLIAFFTFQGQMDTSF